VPRSPSDTIFSCCFTPKYITGDIAVRPTLLARGAELLVETPETATVQVFDISGNLLVRHRAERGINAFRAPDRAGIYIYRVKPENLPERAFRVSVVN